MDSVKDSTRALIQDTAKQWFRDANKRLKTYRKKMEQKLKEPVMSEDETEEKTSTKTKKSSTKSSSRNPAVAKKLTTTKKPLKKWN